MTAQTKATANHRQNRARHFFLPLLPSMADRRVRANLRGIDDAAQERAALSLVPMSLAGRSPLDSFPVPRQKRRQGGYCHDRPLCVDQPERAENLHHARRNEAALQGALRRRVEGRPVQSRFHQDQSELENSRDRRSRRPGRQALYGGRVRRDPDVPRREIRQIPAQGHGEEIRRAAMVVLPGDRASARTSASSPTSRCSRRRTRTTPIRCRAIRPK